MKKIGLAFILIFITLLIIPVATFNTKKNAVSEIDNRALAQDPFELWEKSGKDLDEFDYNKAFTNYVSDRIGMRDEMILAYTEIYDKLFGEMKHPSYTYGKNGEVFLKLPNRIEYNSFHDDFVNMVDQINQYCQARGTPFYFMFEPSKISALRQYLPTGYNYSREWVVKLLDNIRSRGVKVVDNAEELDKRIKQGERVFNKKYDAGHWNDLGAYYGVNNLLANMASDGLNVKENDITDYKVGTATQKTLLTSKFPINEKVINVDTKQNRHTVITSAYRTGLRLDSQYNSFNYYVNAEKPDAPRLMMFRGSYIMGRGGKFITEAFKEYIGIHDYRNVINFDYYYNIFKPDVAVFEVAEYTFTDVYFPQKKMREMKLNPVLPSDGSAYTDVDSVADIFITKENRISRIDLMRSSFANCTNGVVPEYVWLRVNGESFDMFPGKDDVGYSMAIDNEKIAENPLLEIIWMIDGRLYKTIAHIPTPLSEVIMSAGAELTEDGKIRFTTDIENNKFLNTMFQIYSIDEKRIIDSFYSKKTPDTGSVAVREFRISSPSGWYEIRLIGNTPLKDESAYCRVYLEKGKAYYVRYRLEKITDREVIMSDVIFP